MKQSLIKKRVFTDSHTQQFCDDLASILAEQLVGIESDEDYSNTTKLPLESPPQTTL